MTRALVVFMTLVAVSLWATGYILAQQMPSVMAPSDKKCRDNADTFKAIAAERKRQLILKDEEPVVLAGTWGARAGEYLKTKFPKLLDDHYSYAIVLAGAQGETYVVVGHFDALCKVARLPPDMAADLWMQVRPSP